MQKVATVNPQTTFDIEDYCDEFNGNMGEKSKAMVDIYDQLPTYLQMEIEKSFEYQAAVEDGEKVETKPAEPGLADLAKPDEDKDDEPNIPF